MPSQLIVLVTGGADTLRSELGVRGETGATPTEGAPMNGADALTFWDGVHESRPPSLDRRPNPRLTETVTGLSPGDALDLGCGGGGDALWLAGQGWRVTAVDLPAHPLRTGQSSRPAFGDRWHH